MKKKRNDKHIASEKIFIVKLQRPVFSTGPVLCYAYNKTRNIEAQFPLSGELRIMMGTEYKIFCKARLDGNKLVILEKTSPQNW